MRILNKENILDLADYGELVEAIIEAFNNPQTNLLKN